MRVPVLGAVADKVVRGKGFAEKVALINIYAEAVQKGDLFGIFDAFNKDFQTELTREVKNRADYLTKYFVMDNAVCDRLVDLYNARPKIADVGKRTVPHPEIVDRKRKAVRFEGLKDLGHFTA